MGSLNALAEAIIFGSRNTEESFLEVATLKPGKTWADVLKAGDGIELPPRSFEQGVATLANKLGEVVESTTLEDDGF